MNSGITLHVETLLGRNSRRIAESLFKGLTPGLAYGKRRLDPREAAKRFLPRGAL